MFLGTALTKTPANNQNQSPVQSMTLEELDKPENCPENVDLESWNLLCKLRRKKIDSEKDIAAQLLELAETEEVIF